MRLGILGGSFDPIHLGHLLVADDVRRSLKLDRVLFIPSCRPPHKRGPLTPYRLRAAMVRLAIAADPGFELCRLEENRPGPSYTVDTLHELRESYAGAALYFILGSDQYADMRHWHQPVELTRLCRLVVMKRPGTARPRLYPAHSARRVMFRDVIQVAIASAAVRARLAKGESVRYMLPTPVLQYIRRHRLYGRAAGGSGQVPRVKQTGTSPKEN